MLCTCLNMVDLFKLNITITTIITFFFFLLLFFLFTIHIKMFKTPKILYTTAF